MKAKDKNREMETKKIYTVIMNFEYNNDYRYGNNYDWENIMSYHLTREGAINELQKQWQKLRVKEKGIVSQDNKDDEMTLIQCDGCYKLRIDEVELKD